MSDEKVKDEKNNLDQWLKENRLAEASVAPVAPSLLEQMERALRETMELKNTMIDAVEQTARIILQGKQTEIRTLFKYDPGSGFLSIRSYFNFKIPEDKQDAVMILASLKNRYYAFGNDVAFEDYYVHESFPLVMAVIYGGKSPAEVVAERIAKRSESAEDKK